MAYWLDDGFDSWPEVAEAGTPAAGLYSRCGSWLARNIANGRVADAVVPGAIARMYGSTEWVQRLCDVGLWAAEGAGYRDLRYFDLNPTPDQLTDRRRAKAEAGRKGGKASGEARRKQGGSSRFGSAEAGASDLVEPPTQPLPSSKEGRGARRDAPQRAPLRAVADPIEWCGRCNKNTRMAVDDDDRSHPCPDCNPTARAS